MSGIVCAIRGGPSSASTITQAVTLAKETGLPLYFLYVVNLDFLSRAGTTRKHTISEEMAEMGEFILLSAQATASERGVSAEGIVRQGSVEEKIIELSNELDADYVLLGQPQDKTAENVFSQERLKAFAQRIEQNTNAQVIFPEAQP
ncbi:MAG: universal stress protein [Chloroflexota bacterium]|nr:universal stress protein [Chloroflexota bacterium]